MTNTQETRLLAGVFRDAKVLQKKLVLAIALAPPKSKAARSPRGGRRRPRRR